MPLFIPDPLIEYAVLRYVLRSIDTSFSIYSKACFYACTVRRAGAASRRLYGVVRFHWGLVVLRFMFTYGLIHVDIDG